MTKTKKPEDSDEVIGVVVPGILLVILIQALIASTRYYMDGLNTVDKTDVGAQYVLLAPILFICFVVVIANWLRNDSLSYRMSAGFYKARVWLTSVNGLLLLVNLIIAFKVL